jgi:hypothetical protein
VNVDFGADLFDRATDREVGRSRIGRMNAALQADFACTAIPRFDDTPLNFFEVENIGPTTQIFADLALRKGAKFAAEIADIGVVDVAGDDVADIVAVLRRAQRVGCLADDVKGVTTACE